MTAYYTLAKPLVACTRYIPKPQLGAHRAWTLPNLDPQVLNDTPLKTLSHKPYAIRPCCSKQRGPAKRPCEDLENMGRSQFPTYTKTYFCIDRYRYRIDIDILYTYTYTYTYIYKYTYTHTHPHPHTHTYTHTHTRAHTHTHAYTHTHIHTHTHLHTHAPTRTYATGASSASKGPCRRSSVADPSES